jgi:hypothetical protein
MIMKRATIFTALFLMVATLAFSRERVERRSVGEMGAYLQLTAAQQTAWDNAHADFNNATHALFEKRIAFGRQAEAALKDKSADACTIGTLMLTMQSVSDQIRTEENALQQKLVSILTPDQKTKYEAFRAAQGQMFERNRD